MVPDPMVEFVDFGFGRAAIAAEMACGFAAPEEGHGQIEFHGHVELVVVGLPLLLGERFVQIQSAKPRA